MSIDSTIPENCVVCGKPTTSHPVPVDWLCHTWLVERDEDDIVDEVTAPPVSALGVDTELACQWCVYEYTPRDANMPGNDHVGAMLEESAFETLDALFTVSYPRCGRAIECLTTDSSCHNGIDELGLDTQMEVPA